MKFLFIRHGQSSNNIIEAIPDLTRAKYEELRTQDPTLSDLGKMQCELAAEYLIKQNFKVQKVYCSALIRALDSAQILKSKLKCEVEVLIENCEEGGMYHKNKVFTGINKSALEKSFPGFLFNAKEITEEGWFFQDHRENKEEFYQRALRIVKFISELAVKNKNNNEEIIIFISHGIFLNQKMHILLETDKNSEFFFEHENTGITCFETNATGELLLNYFNYTEHLQNLPSKL